MASKDDIIIERASVENAEEILELQKLAYISEAEIINDFTTPPLRQTIDKIISEFKHQVLLKVELDNGIIGSIRCYIENRTCFIGKLIVHPKYQNFGIGTKLLYEAENRFPEAKRYELFTSQKSEKNLHIYLKNGYRIFKSEVVSENLTLLFLEKTNLVSFP
ncbi:MAG: GNAT family N-acetyltransferase [Proteobacteria bacterium]|nr:GNAT family N-acetyltransferase [Pseudomonadota bacterium]